MAEEYKHGSMDITVQEKTFAAFMQFVSRTVIVVVSILLFLAIFNS